MNRKRYEQTEDYKISVGIVRRFIYEVLDGDIEKLRDFCFEDLTMYKENILDYIGDIKDPDMYIITQAIYIILWGDIYNLSFYKMGSWNWKNEYAFRGDTMNSFGSILGKENLKEGKGFAFRAKFYGADKKPKLWKKIEEFYKMYHCIGNFIVIPNRGSVRNGINGARAGYYNTEYCEGMRDYFDWFLIALHEYQQKVIQGDIRLNKFEMQLQMNPEYNPAFLKMEDWEERFFLSPYFKDGAPILFFKTPLQDRLKVTDPNGNDPEKSYFEMDEYLELIEDYIENSKEVIEYRTDRIIAVLKEKLEIREEIQMYDIMDLPETYEEFGKLNGFGEEEMNDEFAPLAKKYYEEAARIIKHLVPFTKEEGVYLMLCYEELGAALRENFDMLLTDGLISRDICNAGKKLFYEMEECSDDEFMVLGFIYDLFEEWFYATL